MRERRLKRWMKELLSRKGLNVDNWRYIRSTSDELVIIHKHSLKPRTIMLRREAGNNEREKSRLCSRAVQGQN
jgi:hypothetical protein